MSAILSSSSNLLHSPIITQNIKALKPTSGISYLLDQQCSIVFGDQPSIHSIIQGLCGNRRQSEHRRRQSNKDKKEEDQLQQSIQIQLIKNQNLHYQKKSLNDTINHNQTDLSKNVNEDDTKKLISEILNKGKQTEALIKNLSKEKSIVQVKKQFQKLICQNQYVKFASKLILTDYYKKRRLGMKLRGLNSDLLQEIQGKLFQLIETQFKLWLAQTQNMKIQAQFQKQVEQFKTSLENALPKS